MRGVNRYTLAGPLVPHGSSCEEATWKESMGVSNTHRNDEPLCGGKCRWFDESTRPLLLVRWICHNISLDRHLVNHGAEVL
jgi:hypothetical protein